MIDLIKQYEQAQRDLESRIEKIESGKISILSNGKDCGREHIEMHQRSIALYQHAIDYIRRNPQPDPPASFQKKVTR